MDFFLTNTQTNEVFHFPVNPEEIQVQNEKKIETIDIIKIGEIDLPLGEKRGNISFSSFLPAKYDTFCQYFDIPNPIQAVFKLDSWRKAGAPLRLIITQSPVNTLVIMPNLDYTIKGGETGDIYYNVSFRSWQEIKVSNLSFDAVNSNSNQYKRPDTKPIPKVYVVKQGDSLWKIAKIMLGSGSRWKDIYNNNTKTIGKNPNLIYAGQRLVMPA